MDKKYTVQCSECTVQNTRIQRKYTRTQYNVSVIPFFCVRVH